MKIFRYFFVGGSAAAVDFILFAIFAGILNWPWFWVSASSFLLATLVNYLLSIRFVFTSGARFSRKQEIILTFAGSGIGLIFNQTILWILIETFSTHLLLAKLIATGSVFIWNYGIRNRYIFAKS